MLWILYFYYCLESYIYNIYKLNVYFIHTPEPIFIIIDLLSKEDM